MKRLEEQDVIRVMREEWDARVRRLSEALEVKLDSPVTDEPIIAPDFKVRHKRSQIRYTVVSVSPRDVILKTPEGEQFLVDAAEFEKDYEVD